MKSNTAGELSMEIGEKVEVEKTITEEDVRKFIEISGDDNPIHTDEEFASRSYFKGRIAHGLLSVGLISHGLTKLFGPGNIWLSYTFKFTEPIRIGDTISARLEIVDVDRRKVYTVNTECYNQDNKKVLEGRAESRMAPVMSR